MEMSRNRIDELEARVVLSDFKQIQEWDGDGHDAERILTLAEGESNRLKHSRQL